MKTTYELDRKAMNEAFRLHVARENQINIALLSQPDWWWDEDNQPYVTVDKIEPQSREQ